jgi:hypothetical protein
MLPTVSFRFFITKSQVVGSKLAWYQNGRNPSCTSEASTLVEIKAFDGASIPISGENICTLLGPDKGPGTNTVFGIYFGLKDEPVEVG